MSLVEELQRLHQLRQQGAINDDEYALAKNRLLNAPAEPTRSSPSRTSIPSLPPPTPPPHFTTPAPEVPPTLYEEQEPGIDPGRQDREYRRWAMFLHLSSLMGLALPLIGFISPVVIWQLKRDDFPELDVHGKNATNWLISATVYAIISAFLCILVIGIPLLIALGAVIVIFPLMAGIKANEGKVWRYPLTIEFID